MKKTTKLILCLFMASMVLLGQSASTQSYAAETDKHYIYFYGQLKEPEQKKFYEAMVEMYESGVMKRGEDYEVTDFFSQEILDAYAKGDSNLLYAFGAARDAFSADYPEIFYVNFSYLSLRMTRDRSGDYKLYIGSGRADNYYVHGFSNSGDVAVAAAQEELVHRKS